MKSTKMKVARFLPLVALLALAPLGPWSCTDAGDEPGSPTGPVTVYDPGRDYTGASVVVETSDGSIQAGQTFTITAEYRDAFGAAVSGAPLTIGTEAAYFSTPADPSYTNDAGRVSYQVTAFTDCPSGTYEFAVYTYPATPMYGPSVSGFVTVRVGGGGVSDIILTAKDTTVASSTPQTGTTPYIASYASFTATATLSTDCTPVFSYQASYPNGTITGWTQLPSSSNPNMFTLDVGTTPGTLEVMARVACSGSSSALATSDAVKIGVTGF